MDFFGKPISPAEAESPSVPVSERYFHFTVKTRALPVSVFHYFIKTLILLSPVCLLISALPCNKMSAVCVTVDGITNNCSLRRHFCGGREHTTWPAVNCVVAPWISYVS
ncbi:hypothetical protein INR49_031902 [Caranx melampygus]|nr:hypothetical protein INR49_031902 [Caranx melampygus]